MKMALTKEDLARHVNMQLNNLLGEKADISIFLDKTLERCEKCFSPQSNKYYKTESGLVYFNPFHSGQYLIFLYFLANTIFVSSGNSLLASKLYYLNKILNSVDLYYEISLPNYWGVEHPLGSVLGRATYGRGFFFYQGCTVGGNKGNYPTIGKHVVLYSNATVVGSTVIGDNVAVSTGCLIKDSTIPPNCIVFGQSPNLTVKPKGMDYMENLLSNFWVTEKVMPYE